MFLGYYLFQTFVSDSSLIHFVLFTSNISDDTSERSLTSEYLVTMPQMYFLSPVSTALFLFPKQHHPIIYAVNSALLLDNHLAAQEPSRRMLLREPMLLEYSIIFLSFMRNVELENLLKRRYFLNFGRIDMAVRKRQLQRRDRNVSESYQFYGKALGLSWVLRYSVSSVDLMQLRQKEEALVL